MSTFSTEPWAPFFAAEAGASAALAGLVFVALSINLQRILSFPQLPGRAAETLAMLVGALILCSVGLVPGESMRTLGAQYAAAGAVVWLFPTVNYLRHTRHRLHVAPVWRIAISVLLAQAATLPAIAAGVLLLAGHPSGLYVLVVAVIFSLIASVLNAWILLVEIIR
jgi:modulator of FtsH protease